MYSQPTTETAQLEPKEVNLMEIIKEQKREMERKDAALKAQKREIESRDVTIKELQNDNRKLESTVSQLKAKLTIKRNSRQRGQNIVSI